MKTAQIQQMILNLEQAKPAGPTVHAVITITAGCEPEYQGFSNTFDMLVAAKNKVMAIVAGVQKAAPGFELKLVSGTDAWTWTVGDGNNFVGVGNTRDLKIWKEARTA